MRKFTNSLAILLLGASITTYAQDNKKSTAAEKSAEIYADGYNKFRFGGYGEILANFMDYGINRFSGINYGNTKDHRNSISIPRFVLAFDYKFNPKWILSAEIEFEAGGTGSAVELEQSENGEYETEIEKGGEVALEQFHITRLIHPAFNISAGHLIVPVGLTNEHHEPINFFGTSRPEGERTLMPSTWHENGIKIFGTFGKDYTKFSYQALIVAGLNANGFDRNTWVAGGKQGVFETDNFTSPAYVGRLNYEGISGLKVGASIYYCVDAGSNSDKKQTYADIGKIPLHIYTGDVQYRNKYITVRGNVVYGNLGNSKQLSKVNTKLPTGSPYSSLTPIAKNAVSYGGEVGINIRSFLNTGNKFPIIYPFARYEYYNPQENGEAGQTMEKRCQVSMWTAGLNWFALRNLVVKADYTARRIGGGKYNNENEFSIGIAYIDWFIKK